MFRTAKERIQALQIPDSVLTKIPTKELVDLCLDFPYMTDMYAFDNLHEGLLYIFSEYNGYRELLNRSDVMAILLEEYRKIEQAIPFLQRNPIVERGCYSIKCDLLVRLISMVSENRGLTTSERRLLLDYTERNSKVIRSNPDLFGSMCKEAVLTASRGLADDEPVVRERDGDLILCDDGSIYRQSSRTTHLGASVAVEELLSEDFDSLEISIILRNISQNYDVTIISAPSRKYNGHGFTWHMYNEHPNDKVWIGLESDTDEDVYWESGSYYSVPPSQATHVSYSGNHSSIRLPNGRYVSKRGLWPLVSHDSLTILPNTGVPIGFYKKYTPTLSGQTLIYTNQTYSITPLPSGYSVEWILSDNYYNQHCLERNYPSQNQCTIIRDVYHNMVNATLSAVIKYNGMPIDTLTKTGLYAYGDFFGNYDSDDLSGTINYTHQFYVRPNVSTSVTSPNFAGATVTYSNMGTIPSYFYFDNSHYDQSKWKLFFVMPANNNGIPIVINVDDVCGNHYQLYAMPQNYYYLNVAYVDDYISMSIDNDVETMTTREAVKRVGASSGFSFDQPWNYEIRSAAKGDLKTSKTVFGRYTTTSTIGWSRGVYIVKATIGTEEITEKIIVR